MHGVRVFPFPSYNNLLPLAQRPRRINLKVTRSRTLMMVPQEQSPSTRPTIDNLAQQYRRHAIGRKRRPALSGRREKQRGAFRKRGRWVSSTVGGNFRWGTWPELAPVLHNVSRAPRPSCQVRRECSPASGVVVVGVGNAHKAYREGVSIVQRDMRTSKNRTG
ncbi:hypothetical protein K438DRAFT_1787920 [Mycena galopus ATCC 62051]|nr:hypothetical protein K438DRAFT_1787920 [Mycena galopus ATCC 62051]